MKEVKNLITNIDTMNATINPIPKNKVLVKVIALPDNKYLTIFKSDAPNITGIDKKNENSAATFLLHNSNIAPRIVTPLLDVPGIKAKSWKQPIKRAVVQDKSSVSRILNSLFLFHISKIINRIP